jgi:hypothetical protein
MVGHDELATRSAIAGCVILFGLSVGFHCTTVPADDCAPSKDLYAIIRRQREADARQVAELERRLDDIRHPKSLAGPVVSPFEISNIKREISRLRGYQGLPRLNAPYQRGVGLLADRVFRVVEVVNKTEMMAICEYYRCVIAKTGDGKIEVDAYRMQVPAPFEQSIYFKGFSTEGRRVGEIFEINDVVKIGKFETDAARHAVYTIIEPFDITSYLPKE